MATRDIPKDRTGQTEELSTILRQTHPGNSHKQRDMMETSSIDISTKDKEDRDSQDKKIRQVTKANVKKQGLLRKFTRYIFEDTIESAKEKAFSDVIKPGLQQLIFDTGNELLSLIIFGTAEEAFRSSRRSSGSRRGERTSYDKYYKDKEYKSSKNSYKDMPYDPDDIILDTNAEARDVLTELDYTIRKYGQASVADLYDIVGVTSEWPDNRYGWTSIRGAKIKPIREGFLLVLPRTHVLD